MKLETTIGEFKKIIDFLKPETKIVLDILEEDKAEEERWSIKFYDKIKNILGSEKINMKDIRDIIMLSYLITCVKCIRFQHIVKRVAVNCHTLYYYADFFFLVGFSGSISSFSRREV